MRARAKLIETWRNDDLVPGGNKRIWIVSLNGQSAVYHTKREARAAKAAIEAGYVSGVADQGYVSGVADQGYVSGVADQGYVSGVADQGYVSVDVKREKNEPDQGLGRIIVKPCSYPYSIRFGLEK